MKSQFTVSFAGTDYPAFYLTTKAEAEKAIIKMMESKEVLAADCETAALPQYRHIPDAALSPHLAKPRLFQFFTGKGAVVIDLFKTGDLPLLGKLFETRPSVFHNKSFDVKMLIKHYGIKNFSVDCTAIMARMCWQSMYSGFKSASLKDVAHALFREDVIKQAGRSDWSVPELTHEQIYYAAKDAIIQMRIYEKLNEWIKKLGLEKCYKVYSEAQNALCHLELNGISFDSEAHRNHIVKWRQQMADARDEVEEITGIQTITDTKIGDWLKKNLPQEIIYLWPKTESTKDNDELKDQKLAVNADALVQFTHLDIVKPFAEFQKYKKMCSSFGTSLFDYINPATGKFHPNYSVAGAATGRLSCSNFNIQQSPRDKDFRSSIVPSPGYKFVVADYGSVEVRCIAELSNEEKLLQAFENGWDAYKFTAANLNNKPMEEVTKQERQGAKALLLGLLYGLGAKKFSLYAKKNYNVEISESAAYKEVDKFRDLYPSLRQWQLHQVTKCEANRYTAFTTLGKSRKLTEDMFYGAALNMPVQGTCAEIMMLALIYVHRALIDTTSKLIACVHDEIVVETEEASIPFVKKVLNEQMTLAYHKILPSGRTLKNLVEASHGDNWYGAKQ